MLKFIAPSARYVALALILTACAGQAPLSQPRPTTPPTPVVSEPSLPDLIAACEALQKEGVIGCQVTRVDGSVLAMVMHFESARELKGYAGAVTKTYTVPFCRAANRNQRPARFYFELHGTGARYLDCELGQWGEISYGQATRPVRSPVQECAELDADSSVPGRCAITREGGLFTLTVSFRSQQEAGPHLERVKQRIAVPFCAVVSEQGESSIYRELYVTEKRGRAFNCETREWGEWFSFQAPTPRSAPTTSRSNASVNL